MIDSIVLGQQAYKYIIAVLIPCHQAHAELLKSCLRGLLSQVNALRGHIYVVNSDDSDAVKDSVDCFNDVSLISGAGAKNAGQARNRGLSSVSAKWIAFIDADCVANANWLKSALDSLKAGAIAVGGPVVNLHPWHPIATMDNLMQFIDQASGRPLEQANAFPGCNLAAKTSVIKELGGFPEESLLGEDTLLTNAMSARWPERCIFLPDMKVQHQGRRSFAEFLKHQERFGYSRGRMGLHISSKQQRLGRYWPISLAAGIKRWFYFFTTNLKYDRVSLVRMLALTPVLLLGLFWWSKGFTAGCKEGTGA